MKGEQLGRCPIFSCFYSSPSWRPSWPAPCSDRPLAAFRALALLGVIALASCQPLPQPFAEEPHAANPLLAVPESYGLVVGEVTGLPPHLALALRRQLARALEQEALLASTGSGTPRAWRLSGAADGVHAGTRLDWVLRRPDGSVAHQFENIAFTDTVSPAFAREVASAVRAGLPEEERRLPPSGSEPAGPLMALAPIDGAPGDGAQALSRALGAALRNRGIRVVPDDSDALSVKGEISVRPLRPGVERVDLAWSVLAPDGEVLGTVTQSNEVPAGALEGRWGAMAEAAADGAADGVVGVLDGLRAQAAGGR